MTEERTEEKELANLFSRVDDLIRRAENGEIPATPFFTPREQKKAAEYLSSSGHAGMARFRGGYRDAERRRIFFLPEYLSELLPEDAEGSEAEETYLGETIREKIATLELRGSGYRELTHRDILGSVLSLGLERDVIGDILLLPREENGREQPRAFLFCDRRILTFLFETWERVGNDVIHLKEVRLPPEFQPERRVDPISDTVASNRLDCVIGALINVSREKAQEAIRKGIVEVDYEVEERTDRRLSPPHVISVRGKGKFRLLSLGEETRKGRLRLRAEQYR